MPRSARANELFFIHLADPGFPDPPWPGERRLGPFLTAEEATDQAINDVAHGHLTADTLIGVFSDSESEVRRLKLRERWEAYLADPERVDDPYEPRPAFNPRDHRAGKAHVVPSVVHRRAATARKKLLAVHAAGIEDQRRTLEAMLPDGVTLTEMMEAAKSPESLAKLLGEKP